MKKININQIKYNYFIDVDNFSFLFYQINLITLFDLEEKINFNDIRSNFRTLSAIIVNELFLND